VNAQQIESAQEDLTSNSTDKPSEYVQPIVILIDRVEPAAEIDGIRAVAVASVTRYIEDLIASASDHDAEGPLPAVELSAWDLWLAGPFAKSVRRADRPTFAKVIAAFDESDYTLIRVGDAKAIAFRPMPNDSLPKVLSRLQVAGTQLPAGNPSITPVNARLVALDAGLEMSTGKAAAQAAHALFLWFLLDPVKHVQVDCDVQILPHEEFVALRDRVSPTAVIVDAGRTEIAPNSMTAFTI
jgi:peptidyl-tRNA hydrolase